MAVQALPAHRAGRLLVGPFDRAVFIAFWLGRLDVLVGSVIFAVLCARLLVICRTGSLRTLRITVDRDLAPTELLDEHGDEVYVVNIQGFVILGMVTQLTTHLRKVLEEQPSIRPVVLDFARVSRLDISAIATIRLRTFAEGALVGGDRELCWIAAHCRCGCTDGYKRLSRAL